MKKIKTEHEYKNCQSKYMKRTGLLRQSQINTEKRVRNDNNDSINMIN